MSEERDRELSLHYRAASTEMPPPALGRALRAAAAEAVATPPKRWHRKWGAPLAMAASVVLGLGMVLRVALERPDLHPAPAPVPYSAPAAAPAPAPAPAVVQRSESGPASAPAAEVQARPDAAARADTAASQATPQLAPPPSAADKAPVPSPPRQASIPDAKPQTGTATEAAAPMRDLARAAPSMHLPPVAASPAAPAAASASGSVRSEAPSMVEPSPGQAAGATMNAAVPERRAALSTAPAARAKSAGAATSQDADSADPSIVAEAGLAPDEWLRRIVVLRGAARHAEADASLARFIRRYPDYRIPAEARAPKP